MVEKEMEAVVIQVKEWQIGETARVGAEQLRVETVALNSEKEQRRMRAELLERLNGEYKVIVGVKEQEDEL